MSSFVTLEEAAKKLGVSTDQLIEMRSRGEIFGYRDGASWKFKPEEIERVASELMGDVLDEDPAGSSILSLDPDAGRSGLGSGLSGVAGSGVVLDPGSDLSLQVDPESSDIRLVAGSDLSLEVPSAGSGLSQVDESGLKLANSDDDDDELSLAIEDSDEILSDVLSGSTPKLGSGLGSDPKIKESASALGSDVSLDSDALSGLSLGSGSELSLSADKSGLIRGDSDPAINSNALSGAGSDLNLAEELGSDNDLVLGGGSDLVLAADSGINLMSPADSGISLEDEPLDLAASGISGLDLAMEGSDAASSAVSGVGSGVGSGINFQQDEDFQLSPSGSLENDDDSGSQVIELEDSSEFGDAAVAIPDAGPGDGFDDMNAVGGAFDSTDAFSEMSPAVAGSAMMMTPEVPYSSLQVVLLMGILLLLAFSGLLMSDVVRNMWAWSGNETANSLTSGITEMLVSLFKK